MIHSYVFAATLALGAPLAPAAVAAPGAAGVGPVEVSEGQGLVETVSHRPSRHHRWFVHAVSDILDGRVRAR